MRTFTEAEVRAGLDRMVAENGGVFHAIGTQGYDASRLSAYEPEEPPKVQTHFSRFRKLPERRAERVERSRAFMAAIRP